MDPVKAYLGALLVLGAVLAEEGLPERFLPPRDFNPHPYERGPVEVSAAQQQGASTPRPYSASDTHPYALLARKRPREGRYPHHKPGDPILYPHPTSVLNELHQSAVRVKQVPQQQQVASEDVYYPTAKGLSYAPQQQLLYQPQQVQRVQHVQQLQQLQQVPNYLEESQLQYLRPQSNHVVHSQTADSNYAFSYSVRNTGSGDDFGHAQARSGGGTRGQYRVRLPDGRLQVVSYVADNHGYRADVRYDEESHTAVQAGPASDPAKYVSHTSSPVQYVNHAVSTATPLRQYVNRAQPTAQYFNPSHTASTAPAHLQYINFSPSATPAPLDEYVNDPSGTAAPVQYLNHATATAAPVQYVNHATPTAAPVQYVNHATPTAAPVQYLNHETGTAAPVQYVNHATPTAAPVQYVSQTPSPDEEAYINHIGAVSDYGQHGVATAAPVDNYLQSVSAPASGPASGPGDINRVNQYLSHSTAASPAPQHSQQYVDTAVGQYYATAGGARYFVTSTTPAPSADERLEPSGFIAERAIAPTTQAPPPDNTASPAPVQFPGTPGDGPQPDLQQQQQRREQTVQQLLQQQRQEQQFQQHRHEQQRSQLYTPALRLNSLLLERGYA